jgi:DNA-binding NarL/FixJ family response regulator
MSMTTVVVADDQGMVRSGLISLLEGDPEVTVVGEASDGAQAVAVVRRTDPDVVLMDIRMPELDGLSATRQLVADGARARVLVLTTFDLDEYVFEALRSGASGFLLKDAPAEELLSAVRVVSRGDAVLSPAVTRRVIEEFAASRPAARTEPSPELTPRELEILRYLGRGLSNAEIAADLVLSESTVKTHVSRVLLKLGLRDRVQAVIYAYECGLHG